MICDVSDEESIVRASAAAGGEHGQLDIAVYSAGVSGRDTLRPLAEYDTAQSEPEVGGIAVARRRRCEAHWMTIGSE